MTRLVTSVIGCIFFFASLQLAMASFAPQNRGASKNLDSKVIAAWQNAGALIGWLAHSESGEWQYLKSRPDDVSSLPVFLWRKYQPDVIAKLPQPAVPFSIGLGGSGMTNAGLKELVGLVNLQALDLSHTKVTDSGLRHLRSLKNLHSLDLGASAVTDAGLKHLADVKSLQKLYFGSTAITDVGVKELIRLTDLRTLYLYNTEVTDAGLMKLVSLKNLQALILGKTWVTGKGIARLAKARPELRILR